MSETGVWHIFNPDGTIAFEWQPDVLLWIPSLNDQPTE